MGDLTWTPAQDVDSRLRREEPRRWRCYLGQGFVIIIIAPAYYQGWGWHPEGFADPTPRRLLATDLAAAQHEALTKAAELLRDLRDAAEEALGEVTAHLGTTPAGP